MKLACGAQANKTGLGRKNAYNVPYSAIVPKRGQGANLLVPVCLSASAVAYSSTRIESMFMYVGTAAGVAAKQLVEKTAATVQEVSVAEVQGILMGKFVKRPTISCDS